MGGGGGGGIVSGIGNVISGAVQSIGDGLASVDKAVGSSIPGGWGTLGAIAATVATAGAASGSLLGDAAVAGDAAATAGDAATAANVVGDASAAGLDAGSAGLGASTDIAAAGDAVDAAAATDAAATAGEAGAATDAAATAEELGATGAAAAGEATGGVAVDAAGLPIEAASAEGGSLFDSLMSGLTPSQGVMLGLAASSLLGSAQKQPQIPSPAPVTPPPAMQSASTPTSLLSQLNGVGQGGGQLGVAQTLLSGANGVDPNSLKLGKNTLLGA